MDYRLFTFCYITFLFALTCNAQYDIEFNNILNSKTQTTLKEKQLDSFIKLNSNKLSQEKLADCFHELGKWYYKKSLEGKKEKNLNNAILYTKKAAVIKRKMPHTDSVSFAKTLFNLGYFYFENNDFFNSIDLYSETLKFGAGKKKINSFLGLAYTYNKTGDFQKALNSYEQLILFAEKDTLFRDKLVEGYLGKIDTYSLMGFKKYSTKIKFNITKVDSILHISGFSKTKSLAYKNRKYQIEGNNALTAKNYTKALKSFFKVLRNLPEIDSIKLARVHNGLGLSFLHLKKLDSARFHLQKSISYDSKFTAPYENMGDLYSTQKEFKKALYHYQKAIDYSVSNNKDSGYKDVITLQELEVAVNKYYLLHHLIQKANGWMQYYHHDNDKSHLLEALKTFKLADRLVDVIRFESTEYKSKLFWREQGASLYRKAVETCYLLKKPEEAYYFMEKNKALLLLEDITNEQAKENTKLPVVVAKREFALKQEIYLSENELNTSQKLPKDSIRAIKDKIYQNKRLYEQFVDSISKIYPEYAVRKKKITVLPYCTFTSKYTIEDEVVLQYILDKDQGYSLLTTSNKSVFFEIKDVPVLIENISLLRKQSSQWFVHQEQLTAYQKNANSIFQKLVPQQVYTLIKGKKVTIVPDYTLQQISFDALTTSAQPHSYFIKDAEIRYAYSMSYLDRKEQVRTTSKHPFIGFAPVTFSNNKLGELPLSKDEVLSIAGLCSGDALLEEKATKTNFLDTIHAYKVIHLSTHADIGDIVDPWIAFRDQKLSLHEIYATKNQSDMVVLSACKTSLGELKQGEGVMSLARGFFHSGTKSVVSSLWATNDKSSQELMLDFYKEINNGATKASALRNAKLNYINSHTGSELSPFYWGSLILIGDNSPIALSHNWYWVGLFAILVFIGITFYLKQKKAKR